MAKQRIDKDSLVRDLRTLGVRPGDLLNVKASLRSIGFVEGGAASLVEALMEAVGPEGTVVTDSFVPVYPLPLRSEHQRLISDLDTPSYAGALANAVVAHPRSFRSLHPVQRFAAIGRQAEDLMRQHTAESPAYDVLRIIAESGGRNLKIGSDEKVVGVGTTHVAINLLGLQQNRRPAGVNYRNEAGEIVLFERNWAGGCAAGFKNFLPHYEQCGALLSVGEVGQAPSKITDMRATLAIELDVLRRNPSFFFCDDSACDQCRLSWEFSTGSGLSVAVHQFARRAQRILRMGVREFAGAVRHRLLSRAR